MLHQHLDPGLPLPPTGGWAATPDFLILVVDEILRSKPALVVEAGSGVSSVIIGLALERVGGGRLVSFEHDDDHCHRTRREVDRFGLGHRVEVVHAPLRDMQIDGVPLRWYAVEDWSPDTDVSLLVVDGPPQETSRLARYPAVPVLIAHLAPGATILLDDGRRADEREAVRRWQTEVPGLTAEELNTERGAWILRLPS